MLALTSSQVACNKGQNLQIYDSNWVLYYDFCYMQNNGVTNHYISTTDTYLVLQFTNSLAQILSTFIHYGLFNLINSPPSAVTSAPATTAAPATNAPVTTGNAGTTTAATAVQGCNSFLLFYIIKNLYNMLI